MSFSSQDYENYSLLRYFFWRHISWQQRLKVLVDIDVLPPTANQPAPQTMERLALEIAFETPGKLYTLWEAIMLLILEEKRTENPFGRM